MKTFILNELKIKKATFITCTLLLLINPILGFILNKVDTAIEFHHIQFIYTIITFALIWECNTLIASSDVRNKVFITYKSLPVSGKKVVLNKYIIYIITSISYCVITFFLTLILWFFDKSIAVISLNSMLIAAGTSLIFMGVQMPIIFRNIEKYLSFIGISFAVLFAIVPRVIEKFEIMDFDSFISTVLTESITNISVLYFIFSLILVFISLKISTVIYYSNMKV